MAKEKVRLWDRLKYKYKLSVINETSYEEVFNFRLSQLHVLTALSVLAVILVVLTILLIAFTDLREFILSGWKYAADDRPKCAPGRFAGE